MTLSWFLVAVLNMYLLTCQRSLTNPNKCITVRITMKPEEFLTFLRRELPKLLREDADFRARVVGTLTESLGTKAEFTTVLEEIRALRADADRRFEAADRRFETIERTLDEHTQQLRELREGMDDHTRQFRELREGMADHTQQFRELRIGMGSLGGRMGRGLEDVIRQAIEGFSGLEKLTAERLILEDEAGEVFGVAGAHVEFDAYVRDGRRFLVEVKSYLEEGDVLTFHRKATFAEKRLESPVEKVIFAPAAERKALETAEEFGISVHTFSVFDYR